MTEVFKADFHIHTEYSVDCDSPLRKIVDRCLELGINCIAIADHGTAEGALKIQDIAPFTVIVAEEILTPYGEIMGMFLKESIPTHISIEEAISRIREQDGLVSLPHPFDTFRGLKLDSASLESLARQADIIEVFNARSSFLRPTIKARTLARKLGLPEVAGSDAHTIGEIGNAYVEMPAFKGKNDFLQAAAQGKILGHRTNPLVHLASFTHRLKNQLQEQ